MKRSSSCDASSSSSIVRKEDVLLTQNLIIAESYHKETKIISSFVTLTEERAIIKEKGTMKVLLIKRRENVLVRKACRYSKKLNQWAEED